MSTEIEQLLVSGREALAVGDWAAWFPTLGPIEPLLLGAPGGFPPTLQWVVHAFHRHEVSIRESRSSGGYSPSRMYPPNPTGFTARSTPRACRSIARVSSFGAP